MVRRLVWVFVDLYGKESADIHPVPRSPSAALDGWQPGMSEELRKAGWTWRAGFIEWDSAWACSYCNRNFTGEEVRSEAAHEHEEACKNKDDIAQGG